MMIAALTMMLAQAAAPGVAADTPVSEEAIAREIVVIGRKLDDWKGGIYKKDGQLTCRIEQSSGDQAIDALRCAAMVKCYSPRVDELDRIASGDATRKARVAKMQAVAEEVKPCLESTEQEGIRLLAKARAAR